MFDTTLFNERLKALYALKANNPYVRIQWKTDGELAQNAKGVLDDIAIQLKGLISDKHLISGNFEVKAARGIAFYPRNPWIGVFIDGETARNGVYPVLTFDADGFFIGCADSIACPQPGFRAECYSESELAGGNVPFSDKIKFDEHLARGAVWFPRDVYVMPEALADALRCAVTVRERFRSGQVQKFRPDEQQFDWCKVVEVDDPYKWMEFVHRMNAHRDGEKESHWAFRGQGNSKWGLASSLERMIRYDSGRIADDDESLIFRKEREAIAAFRRELSKDFGYRTHRDIDLLALMQHYGGKTRLLDFTLSPLMALFMAKEQFDGLAFGNKTMAEKDEFGNVKDDTSLGLSVWAIDLALFRPPCEWVDFINRAARDANAILTNGSSEEFPVLPVFPEIGSARLSAQDGLFIMPWRLNKPLMAALSEMVRSRIGSTSSDDYVLEPLNKLMQTTQCSFSAYKFVFTPNASRHVAAMLDEFRFTAKAAYPDLEGLAKSVTPKID